MSKIVRLYFLSLASLVAISFSGVLHAQSSYPINVPASSAGGVRTAIASINMDAAINTANYAISVANNANNNAANAQNSASYAQNIANNAQNTANNAWSQAVYATNVGNGAQNGVNSLWGTVYSGGTRGTLATTTNDSLQALVVGRYWETTASLMLTGYCVYGMGNNNFTLGQRVGQPWYANSVQIFCPSGSGYIVSGVGVPGSPEPGGNGGF